MYALTTKLQKKQWSDSEVLKITVFDNPAIVWRPLSREPPTVPEIGYCQKLESLRYIFAAHSVVYVYIIFRSHFRERLRKRMYFEIECLMAVQCHPRSLILAPIVSADGMWLPIGYGLPPFRRFSKQHAPLFHPNFGVVPLGLDCRCWVFQERRLLS